MKDWLIIIIALVVFLVLAGTVVMSHQMTTEGDRLCQERGYARAEWIEGLTPNSIKYVECSPEPVSTIIRVYPNE